jgi:hypothetical protein
MRLVTGLATADNQFGFKRKIGCTHAIYSEQTIVNGFIEGGYIGYCQHNYAD